MQFTKAIAAVLSATACAVFAADAPVTYGPPVVVTATRFEDNANRYPIGVQVITEEDIKRSTASTVPDLLRQFAGIRTRDSAGSPNVQVDMRGFGIFGDQNTLVLLDGVRISENEQTTVNWSGIPLSAIERIEVLRGSGAVLYGGGATGGTINIITKKPNQRSAFISGGIASYGTGEITAGGSLAGSNVGLRFNADHLVTDNYRDNNHLRQSNALADVRWTVDRANLSLKVGADDQSLRMPGAPSEAQIIANRRQAPTPGDFSSRSGGYMNFAGDFKLGEAEFAANLGYRNKSTTASFFVGQPFTNNVNSDVSMWSFSPRLRLPWRSGSMTHDLVAGLDWDDWDFEGQRGPAVAAPHSIQRNRALYFQNTTAFSKSLTVSLGARAHEVKYAVNDLINPATTGSRNRDLHAYELAARYRASEGLAIYGKFGNSFRVPNVNDNFNLITGVLNLLEPQKSHDREIGLDIVTGTGQYRFALYHMSLNNELFFDPVAFANRNLPPTRRHGMEADGKWRITNTADLFANYTYAVSEFRTGNIGGVPLAGKDVPLVPRHAFNTGMGWAFAPRTRADVVLRYVGKQVFDSDETNVFGRKMPAYTVVDFKLAYEHQNWLLSAGVKNLLNEKYFSYGVFDPFTPTFFAYPAPERTLFLSAQYNFR